MITIRLLQPHELDFFTDMHYESIHIPQGKPPKDELLNAPHLKKYHEGWGRSGDRAFVAVKDDQHAGAVWYRLFEETNPGFGYVDNETPELGIAIHPDFRGMGIGRLLMNEIIKQAALDGYHSLSLSVDPTNTPAVELYQKLGFTYFGISGTSWTIKLDLAPKTKPTP
ncbi:GNAT family N-acetyltransferase [Paenibacillus sp. 3LSP]|uniref:GNAT family N-acetyltransferase n=1 Tax=Paenibacillus sp. 3LSP TaxID=2800795 RepID=UPI0028FD0AE3|nr:GNAT family N-acetyltransferase [Paenibacillus sp. 3LSP]MDU0331290.1 GNAT family N-acetyltransferase [Paenibacillus sp. 3LSP]